MMNLLKATSKQNLKSEWSELTLETVEEKLTLEIEGLGKPGNNPFRRRKELWSVGVGGMKTIPSLSSDTIGF